MDFVIFFVAFKPIVTEFWPAERLIRVSLEEKYTSVQTNYMRNTNILCIAFFKMIKVG